MQRPNHKLDASRDEGCYHKPRNWPQLHKASKIRKNDPRNGRKPTSTTSKNRPQHQKSQATGRGNQPEEHTNSKHAEQTTNPNHPKHHCAHLTHYRSASNNGCDHHSSSHYISNDDMVQEKLFQQNQTIITQHSIPTKTKTHPRHTIQRILPEEQQKRKNHGIRILNKTTNLNYPP